MTKPILVLFAVAWLIECAALVVCSVAGTIFVIVGQDRHGLVALGCAVVVAVGLAIQAPFVGRIGSGS